jgi:dipeptidyl aminopeptidase/acylaminoacyl peptidase
VAISMRGFGRSAGEDDCGLEQPDDVGEVVAALRAEAPELQRVGLLGISQGGLVALLAAARGSPVDAVAAWAPVTDVARWRATTSVTEIRAYIDDRCADGLFADRSPLALAQDLRLPVLLVHGDADTRVPTEQSLRLDEAIRGCVGDVELVLLPGVEHRRGPDGNRRAMDRTLAFFATHLGAGAGR